MTDYDTLNLAPSATPEEIKLAYKRLVMRLHPDRGGDPAEFQKVQRAYERLLKNKCPDCAGTGQLEKRNGAFVVRLPCPRCWSINT